MNPFDAAKHEISHAAAASVTAYSQGIDGAIVHLEVNAMPDATSTMGSAGFAHEKDGVSQLLTSAAAVGPIALLPDVDVARHIHTKTKHHPSLSDLDVAAMQKYPGDPATLIAPTWALLNVTGTMRLHKMATALVHGGYVELPLFDLFPKSRVQQALKRVKRIQFNAHYHPNDLLRPIPAHHPDSPGFTAEAPK